MSTRTDDVAVPQRHVRIDRVPGRQARVGPAALHRARGLALVPAIFLIVVLSALAAWAVRLGSQQQQTVTLAVLGARALAAANAGVEWGAWRALHGSCADGTLVLDEGALSGFSVAVTCTATSLAEGATTLRSYVLESVAVSGSYGQPDYVRRRVRVTLAATG